MLNLKKSMSALLILLNVSVAYAESDPYEYDFSSDNRFPNLQQEKKAVVGPTSPNNKVPVFGPTSPGSVVVPIPDNKVPVFGPTSQTSGLVEQRSLTLKSMSILASTARMIRHSISLALQTSENAPESVNCFSSNYPSNFKGKCEQLVNLKDTYGKLQSQVTSLEKIINELDKNIFFTKIGIDSSGLSTDPIPKGVADVFAADKTTPDCTSTALVGWKCLKTTITTYDGNTYNIQLKWNRPLKTSKATLFLGLGGDATYDPIEDRFQRALFTDHLNGIDGIRTVSLQMIDPPPQGQEQGGYWIHGGGYHNLGQIFMAAYDVILKNNLIHGNYTNYYGGSNGTMLLASAMARYNADAFFDRVVFQAGPFLPSLKNACDKNSASSFYRSTPEQQKLLFHIFPVWSYIFPDKYDMCAPTTADNLSLLKPGYKTHYPNTILHVVMGAQELTDPFGQWILDSNQEWYNSITAKSKERIVRPYVGHNTSYEDTRRFLKLAPNEKSDYAFDKCVVTNTGGFTKSCGCGIINDADLKEDSCFYKASAPAVASCSRGTFVSFGISFEYSCGCGEVAGGVLQKDGCYHKRVDEITGPAPASACSKGTFVVNGQTFEYSCGCGPVERGVLQKDGCYHREKK